MELQVQTSERMVRPVTKSSAGMQQKMGHSQDLGTIPSHVLALKLVTIEPKVELIATKISPDRLGYKSFGN